MKNLKIRILFYSILLLWTSGCRAPKPAAADLVRDPGPMPAHAPYPYLGGGHWSNEAQPFSPDPTINYQWEKSSEELQIYYLRPVLVKADHEGAFEGTASATGPDCNVLVKGEGSLMLDFGVESAAWLEFDSPDLQGEVTASISEYNQPGVVNAGPEHPVKTAALKKYGNTYRLELNKELYEGVRFAWIHVSGVEKPWHITGIRLVCQVKPVNYTGSFSCSDPVLNKIWYTGAYTVKLNLLKDYFGAILIDRGDRHSWTGDAHTSQAAALVAFSNYTFIKENIRRTAGDDNNIESYSLYWIQSLIDYFLYTGDRAFLKSMLPVVEAKVHHALEIYGKRPSLVFYGWDERLGAGFEHPDVHGNQQAYKLLFIQTCRLLGDAMQAAGYKTLERKYRQLAENKMAGIRQETGWMHAGIHAAAEALNTGFLTSEEKRTLALRYYDNPVNRISFSPFNQYFIIRSMAALGRHREALATVRSCWGGQIELGATTFWECYRPEWNRIIEPNAPVPNGQSGYTSLCHPWSSGVTKWLSEEILGIKPTAPGFASCMVAPQLAPGLTWVKGSTPTPHGNIEVSLDIERGTGRLKSPRGTLVSFRIPKNGRHIRKVEINGKTAWDERFHPVNGVGNAIITNDYLEFGNILPGQYDLKIHYREAPPWMPSEEAWNYPAAFSQDSLSGTEWQSNYGRAGYILFNSLGKGRHTEKLPSFIRDIRWKSSGPGSPAMSDPEKGGIKNGSLRTQNPAACMQTFYMDVISGSNDTAYRCTLYFAPGDSAERKFTVDIFDQASGNLLAPTCLIPDTKKVRYLSFEYDRAVRVRISHVRGENALVNGIFFDEIPAE